LRSGSARRADLYSGMKKKTEKDCCGSNKRERARKKGNSKKEGTEEKKAGKKKNLTGEEQGRRGVRQTEVVKGGKHNSMGL